MRTSTKRTPRRNRHLERPAFVHLALAFQPASETAKRKIPTLRLKPCDPMERRAILGVDRGHRVLFRDYIMGTTPLLVWDPGPFDLPVILTVAHVAYLQD